MEKRKGMKSVDGEIPLPEAMVQHIQSFLSGKEAARTTIVSKSWYSAWLTRPSLNIDTRDFANDRQGQGLGFAEFATKTMQRYQDSSLKIDSFTLRSLSPSRGQDMKIICNLIIKAMKIGATDLELEFEDFYHTLPQEVLESETLARLSLSGCRFDRSYAIRCSTLKSLALRDFIFTNNDVFNDIIMCCSISIEELSLSGFTTRFELKGMDLYGHKLRRLYLSGSVKVDTTFFTDFTSRFPCLKDLSIDNCLSLTRIQLASTSLETISFKMFSNAWKCRAHFDVPNIRKFTYFSSSGLPALSINGGSREWELDISIHCNVLHEALWFLKLKRLLAKFRLSRISLFIKLESGGRRSSEQEVDIEVVRKPLALENLRIDGTSSHCCALLVRLFAICRPKFITHYWLTAKCYPGSFRIGNAYLVVLCKKLMHQGITPNGGIPDQNMFGMFNLKKVNVEVYEMFDAQWQPLVLKEPLDASETPVNKRRIRFQLIWED